MNHCFAILLFLSLLISLSGCGNSSSDYVSDSNTTAAETFLTYVSEPEPQLLTDSEDRTLVPVSVIAYSADYFTQHVTAEKLYSAIQNSNAPIRLAKVYIMASPATTNSNEVNLTHFMNTLHAKDSNTSFSLLGQSAAQTVDLDTIGNAFYSGTTYPSTPSEIETFMQNYAQSVLDDITILKTLNSNNSVKLKGLLLDVEASYQDPVSVHGLFYLLYYTRAYMNNSGLESIALETTLKWQQAQYAQGVSVMFDQAFGKSLSKELFLASILNEYRVTSSAFVMNYRHVKDLSGESIFDTNWWITYTKPDFEQLSSNNYVKFAPAVGINAGDPAADMTQNEALLFFQNYAKALPEISSDYAGKFASAVLGINAMCGLYNILSGTENTACKLPD